MRCACASSRQVSLKVSILGVDFVLSRIVAYQDRRRFHKMGAKVTFTPILPQLKLTLPFICRFSTLLLRESVESESYDGPLVVVVVRCTAGVDPPPIK